MPNKVCVNGHREPAWQIRGARAGRTREDNREFLYLGADQGAIEDGAKVGFAGDKSVTYRRGRADDVMAEDTSALVFGPVGARARPMPYGRRSAVIRTAGNNASSISSPPDPSNPPPSAR